MIATYVHNETGKNGEPVFIIQTRLPKTRKFLGVPFLEGEGRTKFAEKAKRFDEEFGYTVILPKGFKPWTLAGPAPVAHASEYETENVRVLDEDE